MDNLAPEGIKYIISRLIENANEAHEDYLKDKKNDFYAGRKVAYYEMLDILKTELSVREQELKELGLDVDLEKEYL